MTFSSSRVSELKLDTTPSFFWNNLTCNQDLLAYSNRNTVVVLNSSALGNLTLCASSKKFELSPLKDGVVSSPNITQTSFVTLDCGRFLVATSPSSLVIYDCADLGKSGSPSPVFRKDLCHLDPSILEGRKPESHFFRGIAGPLISQRNVIFVGTSWGAILAWRAESKGAGFEFSLFQVLSGGHGSPITCIAADER